MIKKQLLALTFAALALNAAAQPLAAGNKDLPYNVKSSFNIQNINSAKAGSFFLSNKLGSTNLNDKLSKAYTVSLNQSAPKSFCNSVPEDTVKRELVNKIKSFDLEKECKKVKPDTPIVKIDYSKVRPHMHKRKILAAVRSEIKASDEIAQKRDTLKRIADNFTVIAKKAYASNDSRKNRDLLCLVDRALYAVKKTDYILALEITKQAVNK